MMSTEHVPFVFPLKLGSPSADDAVIAGAYFYAHRKCKLTSVVLVNAASIAASNEEFMSMQLLNGSDIVAEFDTRAAHENGLTADVGKAMNLVADEAEIAAGTTLKAKYDKFDGQAEITRITCVADDTSSLTGTGFLIDDDAGKVLFWIDVDNAGASAPSTLDGLDDRKVEITTITEDMTAAQVATALAAAIDADSKFVAVVDPDDDEAVIVTSSAVGVRDNAVDGATTEATGFTFTVEQEGNDNPSVALTNAVMIVSGHWIETA
jgi:hypothetical protein